MGIDFDALVLGPAMAVFGDPAVLTPVKSQDGVAGYPIRGVFTLKGADIPQDDGAILRADVYTFGVRASEFPILVTKGDELSEIRSATFARFLEGRTFIIDDTGDDGQGGQTWILKEQRLEDDEP